jgi:hypothetical protein
LRSTDSGGDLDFWIRRSEENAARVLRSLRAFGAPTDDFTIADFHTTDLFFQIGVEPSRIAILTSVDGVEFDDAWKECEIARVNGLEVPVMSLAHVIQKLSGSRPIFMSQSSILWRCV